MYRNKFILIIFILLFVIMTTSSGCVESRPQNQYNEILDDTIKNGLFNYEFGYEFYTPGGQLSYNFLWDGYDENNKYGPKFSKETRLYTYLTEYKEVEEQFYLIYIEKSEIYSHLDWFIKYEMSNAPDHQNYHFTSHELEKIIDGKYLFSYRQFNEKISDKLKFYTVSDLDEIKFEIDGYQLVFCSIGKNAIIKENLSTTEKLDKNIKIFKRYTIQFENNNSAPTYYVFDNFEANNENIVTNRFDYVGEVIEVFFQSYEDMLCCNSPVFGMKECPWINCIRVNVVYHNNQKCVLLPRYIVLTSGDIDLLSYDSEFGIEEDVFGNYKEAFREALIEDANSYKNGLYLMSLYDYESVADIIKMK